VDGDIRAHVVWERSEVVGVGGILEREAAMACLACTRTSK